MKKILILIICFLFIDNILALEDIKIDNNSLIPEFNKNIHIYNYFTNNDEVNITVKKSKNEIVYGDGIVQLKDNKNKIIINGNNKYIINIFKNYNKNNREEEYVENIEIDGYEINFNKNIHEYKIYINDETNLDINCEMSNVDDYYSIEGNGNFNKSDNIIRIKTKNDEYIIHAYKTINVSFVEKNEVVKEMSGIKKEIVKILIVTISCALIVFFYYTLFINKTTLSI